MTVEWALYHVRLPVPHENLNEPRFGPVVVCVGAYGYDRSVSLSRGGPDVYVGLGRSPEDPRH